MFIESSFCHKLFIAEKKPFFLPANQKQIFLTHCNGQNALVFSLVMIVSLVGRNGSVSREQGVFHLLTQDLQEVLQEPPPTSQKKKEPTYIKENQNNYCDAAAGTLSAVDTSWKQQFLCWCVHYGVNVRSSVQRFWMKIPNHVCKGP